MKIRSKLLTKLAALIMVGTLKLLFLTLRFEIRCPLPELNSYEYDGPNRYLYSLWHDLIVFPLFVGNLKHMSTLVSRHQDGSFLAESMKLIGISAVRGSTKRGGTQAVRELMSVIQDMHVTITPDGPRGPRRKIKNGIVFLASHTGRPMVPTAFSSVRFWRIRGSWTDMVIPKPFTKVYALAGEPITVPENLSREELDRYAAKLQEAADALQLEADHLAQGIEQQPPALKAAA